MRLKLNFDQTEPSREVNWWKRIEDFPALLTYKGKKWEFIMYDKSLTFGVDFDCQFVKIDTWTQTFWQAEFTSLESLTGEDKKFECQCGAIHTEFPQFHMFYCPLWTRNGKI